MLLAGCIVLGDEIVYSHATHVVRDTGCLACHAPIDEATTVADHRYTPGHEGCHNCHDTAQPTGCMLCHTAAERATRTPPSDRGLIFSHKRHMEPARGNCMKCHLEIPSASEPTESRVPAMDVCTESCHAATMAALKCDQCHVDLTRYHLEEIRLFAHGSRFERRHGTEARQSRETCAQCHERSFCADCHSGAQVLEASTKLMERTTRAFIHPEPYEALHVSDARVSGDKCQTCHRPAFCESCHARQMVATIGDLREAPHPEGWSNPASIDFHGFEARRNITTCAACHDQGAASVCVRCHQVGGPGGNPHPAGYAARSDTRENRMCRTCHTGP